MRKIEERRENEKGFTLAELLIVVAIIGVLVAIAVPVFNTQLDNARQATDKANIRSAVAEVTASYLTNGGTDTVTVESKSKTSGGFKEPFKLNGVDVEKSTSGYTVAVDTDGKVTVNGTSVGDGGSGDGGSSTPATP